MSSHLHSFQVFAEYLPSLIENPIYTSDSLVSELALELNVDRFELQVYYASYLFLKHFIRELSVPFQVLQR